MNYFAVDLYLMDSVSCMCLCRSVCVCMLCMYSCWAVYGRRCNYVWMYSVCSLALAFLQTIKGQEGLVVHVKAVPFLLMRVNVCNYPL